MAESRLGVDGIEAGDTIGSGGNAVVFKAWEPDHDRWVAVKILRGVGDEDARRRFQRERKAMGRLSQHGGIVTIFRSGLNEYGEPYLVMPFFEEGSLQDRLNREGPLPWEEACKIISVVARTVQYAHEQGVIHRDLKPANVLISGPGHPLVADFGIAKITAGTTSSVATTAFTFTPGYSPPEVLDNADPAVEADVYSLGATLYALIRGFPPFSAEPNESLISLLRRIADDPAPPLDPMEAPIAVSELIGRALSKDQTERSPTAMAFADDLDRAVASGLDQPVEETQGQEEQDSGTQPGPTFRAAPTIARTRTAPAGPPNRPWWRNALVAAAAAAVIIITIVGVTTLIIPDNVTSNGTAGATSTMPSPDPGDDRPEASESTLASEVTVLSNALTTSTALDLTTTSPTSSTPALSPDTTIASGTTSPGRTTTPATTNPPTTAAPTTRPPTTTPPTTQAPTTTPPTTQPTTTPPTTQPTTTPPTTQPTTTTPPTTTPLTAPALRVPPAGFVVPQNVSIPGCPPHPTRGGGWTIPFEWGTVPAATKYHLFVERSGASLPLLEQITTSTSRTLTSCNGFIIDSNLTGWHWRVRAIDVNGTEGPWSGWRNFSFEPCRLNTLPPTACHT